MTAFDMADGLARAIEASDGPWPVMAIALIGVYALIWKFGSQILAVVRESNVVAKQAHSEAKQISTAIVTNHGSKNIGDAIDRLTEQVGEVSEKLDNHITIADQLIVDTTGRFADLSGRLNKLEED